jgi:hypothetical protein
VVVPIKVAPEPFSAAGASTIAAQRPMEVTGRSPPRLRFSSPLCSPECSTTKSRTNPVGGRADRV